MILPIPTKIISNSLPLILLVLFSSSCSSGAKMVPSGPNVGFTFDWHNLSSGDALPQAMHLYFYGADGSVVIRQSNGIGFHDELPEGTYQVLAFNGDGVNIAYRNLEHYDAAEIYTPLYTRATYASQPSRCYAIGLGNITISYNDTSTIVVTPDNLVTTSSIDVEGGDFASDIVSCSGSLSGFSTAMQLVSRTLINATQQLYFDTEQQRTSYHGTFSFLGKLPEEPNVLALEFELTSGATQRVSMDITNLLDAAIQGDVSFTIEAEVALVDNEVVLTNVHITPWEEVNAGQVEIN